MASQVPSIAVLRARAVEQLTAVGIDSAATDVDQLLMHALDVTRTELLLATADQNQVQVFEQFLERRANREPLQHIVGKAYFRHLALDVGPGVFVPRPETEVLVDLALAMLPDSASNAPATPLGRVPTSIVDLCAGSAAIGLAVATELDPANDSLTVPVTIYSVELDEDSIEWTRRNVEQHRTESSAGVELRVVQADARTAATEELARLRGQVSMVTCNPPYIPDAAIPRDPEVRDYDPAVALFGGPDGLDVVRDIVHTAADLLHPGGALLIEHGDQQGESDGELGVPRVVRDHGAFVQVDDHLDLTGRPRVTVALRR